MVMMNPFANSLRATPTQTALRSQMGMSSNPEKFVPKSALNRLRRDSNVGVAPMRQDLSSMKLGDIPDINELPRRAPVLMPQGRRQAVMPQERAVPANPFEGNEQYQALMDFQKSLAPSAEQQARLQELQSAFEGSGAYKDYRINQLQNQLQQRQMRNPRMGMGLGGMRPMGMEPYQQFGRRPTQMQRPMRQPMQMPMQRPMPVPRGGYNQYQQQFGGMMGGYQQNPYQQMRPQPQQFGGYGMGQQMGGYGSYGQMPNPYQPQQMGYNPNNFSGYQQQYPAMNQFQGF